MSAVNINKTNKNDLITGKISSTLLRFTFPFLISNFLQQLYGAADLFVVGQFSVPESVSAVSIGSQIIMTITNIIIGLSTGGIVLIGHSVGKKDDEGTAKGVGTLVSIFAVLAVIITPLMVFSVNNLVSLMQTPTQAVEFTREYVLICACGIPFIIGYNAVNGIFSGLGDSKTPVYFIGIACAVNIAVDFVLVKGFNMHAKGAAIATVAAQAISFFVALIYIIKKGFFFPFNRHHIKFDKYSTSKILKVGVPLALQNALTNISFLIITAIINTMGLTESAGVGVVEKIIGFAMLVPISFSAAVATMTAQNIGASKPERAVKSVKFGIIFSLIFGVAVFILSNLFPERIASIFASDSAVINEAAKYLRMYTFDCVLVSFIFCMNSYFNGCGKPMITVIHGLIATFAIRIPASYLISKIEGATLFHMGFAPPIASIVSVIICMIYFIYLNKERQKNT